MNTVDELAAIGRELPETALREVLDFARFLRQQLDAERGAAPTASAGGEARTRALETLRRQRGRFHAQPFDRAGLHER